MHELMKHRNRFDQRTDTLDKCQSRFAGDVHLSLKAIRPLVAGVAELHKADMVHRDIKAQNIFLSTHDKLVLGDFGLVYFTDNNRTRISNTLSNVGSWEWMPAWAQNKKPEEVARTFDVFCLGKLLWWMVSGLPIQQLQFWHFEEEAELNVEEMFPDRKYIRLINPILRKSVVQREHQCLADATALLAEIDNALKIVESDADLLSNNVQRNCRVCGLGSYVELSNREVETTSDFGLSPGPHRSFKIYRCNRCGHVQMFTMTGGKTDPPGWEH